jgi:hypothetical protein
MTPQIGPVKRGVKRAVNEYGSFERGDLISEESDMVNVNPTSGQRSQRGGMTISSEKASQL